ncbi:Copper transporter 6 [Apostasia shenzhenica]|uniref:Copper transport protein n=1 Tax=Apostasia shenzhenica TaxID=1088818 RepID=A0A2I0AIB4_9ASPA|nr:Copper transporter 6 [Apostasia shenzhenica]
MDHSLPSDMHIPTSAADSVVTGDVAAAAMGRQAAQSRSSYTHMTFYWGKDSEILFAGWPGTSTGMYALATLLVFSSAVIVEWLGRSGSGDFSCRRQKSRAAAAYALRVAVAYIVMLAVMSFNVGILVAAVAGHVIGYMWFAGAPAAGRCGDEEGGKAGRC